MPADILPGAIYQHYKGPRYQVITTAKHSETLETFVVYKCLYENEAGQDWIRPLEMFTGTIEINGVVTPRFKPVKEV